MIIKPFDTYSTLAIVEADTMYGKPVTCRIKKRGSTPNIITPLTGKQEFLFINMLPGSETMTRIRGVEATLRLNNITNFQVLNIIPEGNKDYLLEVDYDSNKVFSGFLNPDQYNEPFNTAPYTSEINFADGIGLLKDVPFADLNECYYRGYYKDIQIIAYCLAEIGINRNIIDCIDIYDTNTADEDKQGTLSEKWKNVEAFKGMSCYDVIDNILKCHISRIDLINDKWVIRRINSNEVTLDYFEWQMNEGGSVSNIGSGSFSNSLSLTGASEAESTRAVFVNSSQELFRLSGFRELEITQLYGRKPTILPRGMFERCDFNNGTPKLWDSFAVIGEEVEEEYAARIQSQGPFADVVPIEPRAYLETTTIDNYNTENTTGDGEDLFELSIILKNNNSRPLKFRTLGISTRPGGRTANGTPVIPGQPLVAPRETVEIGVTLVAGQPYFKWTVSEYNDFIDRTGFNTSVDKFYMIFTDPDNVPTGYQSNIPYLYTTGPYFFTFGLKKTENLLETGQPNVADVDRKFSATVSFIYFPCTIGFDGDNRINNEGIPLNKGFLNIEIPDNALRATRFSSVGIRTTDQVVGPFNSPIKFKLERPVLNYIPNDANNNLFFRLYIESIQLQIADTPESKTQKLTINQMLRGKYELEIMFAETPIKNNFVNNKLKFFNNYFSRSLTEAPGFQVIGSEESTLGKQETMYDIISKTYRNLLKKYRYAIRGTINAPELSIFGKVMNDEHTAKSYVMNECRWNIYRHYYETELHEVSQANDVPTPGDFTNDYSDDFEN